MNEELEYKKCANDILYFIERYCKDMNFKSVDNTYIRRLKMNIINEPNNSSLRQEVYKIGKIKLRDYQKEIIENFKNNNFLINLKSRQMGISMIYALLFLHVLLFNKDKKILIVNDKPIMSKEFISIIIYLYNNLPSFLKINYNYNGNDSIFFKNNSSILSYKKNLKREEYDIIYFDEFAYISDVDKKYNELTNYYLKDNGRIIITSTPNGNNLFYKLVQDSESNNNKFKTIRTYWYQIPNRDQDWKNKQILMLGSEERFKQQFELTF